VACNDEDAKLHEDHEENQRFSSHPRSTGMTEEAGDASREWLTAERLSLDF